MAVTPDLNKIAVFNKGTSKGLIAFNPTGPHCMPNSWLGTREESKKDQKKPKKNITSLKINKAIPNFKPSIT